MARVAMSMPPFSLDTPKGNGVSAVVGCSLRPPRRSEASRFLAGIAPRGSVRDVGPAAPAAGAAVDVRRAVLL
jgi:hypothetical protein